jgi:hypothetical protein
MRVHVTSTLAGAVRLGVSGASRLMGLGANPLYANCLPTTSDSSGRVVNCDSAYGQDVMLECIVSAPVRSEGFLIDLDVEGVAQSERECACTVLFRCVAAGPVIRPCDRMERD